MCQQIVPEGREYVSGDSRNTIVSVGEINYTVLIDFIREALNRKKMTPNKLAIKSGLPAQSLYRFLNGQRGLEPSSITKLAAGLEIDPAELHRLVPGGVFGDLSEGIEDRETNALRIQLIGKFNTLDKASRQTLVNLAEALAESADKQPKAGKPSRARGKGNS